MEKKEGVPFHDNKYVGICIGGIMTLNNALDLEKFYYPCKS